MPNETSLRFAEYVSAHSVPHKASNDTFGKACPFGDLGKRHLAAQGHHPWNIEAGNEAEAANVVVLQDGGKLLLAVSELGGKPYSRLSRLTALFFRISVVGSSKRSYSSAAASKMASWASLASSGSRVGESSSKEGVGNPFASRTFWSSAARW